MPRLGGSVEREGVTQLQLFAGCHSPTNSLQVRVLPRGPAFALSSYGSAGHFWNANRTSEPGLGANECVPSGKWRKSTEFRHFLRA